MQKMLYVLMIKKKNFPSVSWDCIFKITGTFYLKKTWKYTLFRQHQIKTNQYSPYKIAR